MAAQDTEQRLERDLQTVAERTRDEKFSSELYRGLANTVWRHRDDPDARVSLSWKRAEAVVNGLRATVDGEALTLAQTGGEGEVSDDVHEELEALGWHARSLDTSHADSSHVTDPASAPPPEQGERRAPGEASDALARGHEEAEQERRRS